MPHALSTFLRITIAIACGIALVLPLELWLRRRSRDPFRGMQRYVGEDGREWAYHRRTPPMIDGGGGEDGGSGHDCGHGDGGGGGH